MLHSVRREIIAGLSTFFTMAYLLLLYPRILSEGGIDFGAALTATILILVFSTLFLAAYAHFPAVLAPGLSIGPFLVYSVILKQGASWQTALGMVFWAGLAIIVLSLFKVRQKILLHLPPVIKTAAISGIGLFLICIGLKDLQITTSLKSFATVPNGIALFGLLLFFLLNHYRIAAAFLISILSCWLVSLIFGLGQWRGFADLPYSLTPTLFNLNFWEALQPKWFGTILSIILISLFDTSASLTALAKLGHQLDEKGRIKNLDRIVIPDGIGSMGAALLGTGTLAFLLESSSGIKAGGKGGLTAAVAALATLTCLFLYPLISSIPLYATVPALIAIGIFMAREIKEIEWKKPAELIPALVMTLTIPLTFSIYLGFAYGFISYTALKIFTGQYKKIHPICWGLTLIFGIHLSWMMVF
ncbi:MAG: NCS2 family permease [Chlamydiota bacterium]